MRVRDLLLVFLIVFVGGLGCAPTVRSASAAAAESAVPAAADATLRLADDPETRARVAKAMATPEVQEALESLASGVAKGALDGLASEEATARVNELAGRVARAIAAELARGIVGEVGPAIAEVTKRSVEGALDAAMSPERQAQLAQMIAAVVISVMHSSAQEMVRSPELKSAMGETARELARQVVLGSNDGLAEVAARRQDDASGNPLGIVGALLTGNAWLVSACVTAFVFGIPLVWLARTRRRAREQQREADRRSARAAALLDAMDAAPEGRWSNELLLRLREELVDENARDAAPTEAPRARSAEAPPGSRTPPRPRHA